MSKRIVELEKEKRTLDKWDILKNSIECQISFWEGFEFNNAKIRAEELQNVLDDMNKLEEK